jgi:hypothetical protein
MRVRLTRGLVAVLLAAVMAQAVRSGLELRRWAWDFSQPCHFFSDIERGFRYGRRALTCGYLDLYDLVITEHLRPDQYNELDYAPLRLLVMREWARENQKTFPDVAQWQNGPKFSAPVLHFNAALELAGAVGMFLLARLWVRRGTTPPRGPDPVWTGLSGRRWWRATLEPFRGCGAGLLAALLLWFNPTMILSAHTWPTWDMWIVPFYIYVVLLVSCGWWFSAGVVLALGALCKGQQLLVAPLFVLVPLFMGRPGAALRLAVGLAFGVAAVVAVWMLRVPLDGEHLEQLYQAAVGSHPRRWGAGYFDPIIDWRQARDPAAAQVNWPAVRWVLAVPAGLALAAARHLFPRTARRWWLLPAACGAGLLLWRWQAASGGEHLYWGLMATATGIGLAWWLPLRRQGYLFAGAAAAALLLCMPFFHASSGWLTIGWCYGTYHWETMVMGLTSNIPGLLERRFTFDYDNRWDLLHEVFSIPARGLWFWPATDYPITLKTLLGAIYGWTLLLCSVGAARHLRHGDRRFLVAVVAPWALFFAILGQMHERYLLWAAALSAVLVAVDWGYLFLHLFLTAASSVQIIHVLMSANMGYWRNWRAPPLPGALSPLWCRKLYIWTDATHPDLAWAVAAAAALLLYGALIRQRTGAAPLSGGGPVAGARGSGATGAGQPVARARSAGA